MKKTAIFYGSASGNCEGIANKIAEALGISDVFSVSQFDASKIAAYDNLLLGSSTWGCGDSGSFSTTFCDAIGTLYEAAKAAGANMIGAVSTDGYSFYESNAVVDGKFVGLALNEDNESDRLWMHELELPGQHHEDFHGWIADRTSVRKVGYSR